MQKVSETADTAVEKANFTQLAEKYFEGSTLFALPILQSVLPIISPL